MNVLSSLVGGGEDKSEGPEGLQLPVMQLLNESQPSRSSNRGYT